MARSVAELDALIAAHEARMTTIAGVSATRIADQSTDFDRDGLASEIARLKNERALAASSTGSRTRYAAFDKGV